MITWMSGIKSFFSLGSILMAYGLMMRHANTPLHRVLMGASLLCCWGGLFMLLLVWQVLGVPPQASLWVRALTGESLGIPLLLVIQAAMLVLGVLLITLQAMAGWLQSSWYLWFYRVAVPVWWLVYISAMLVYN